MLEVTLVTDTEYPSIVINTEYKNIDRVFDPDDAMIVKELADYLIPPFMEAQRRVNGVDYYVKSVTTTSRAAA